jgi:hypothetical protein
MVRGRWRGRHSAETAVYAYHYITQRTQEERFAPDMPSSATKKRGGAGSSGGLSTPSPSGKGEFLGAEEGNEAVEDKGSGLSDSCSIRAGLNFLAHV